MNATKKPHTVGTVKHGTRKVWLGSKPERCGLCGTGIKDEFVDGAVCGDGRWGIMCPGCHTRSGAGLGTGLGQRYVLQANGAWVKQEG